MSTPGTRRYRGKGKTPKGSRSETGVYQLGREQKDKRNAKRREQRKDRKIVKQQERLNTLRKENQGLNRMVKAKSSSRTLDTKSSIEKAAAVQLLELKK